GGCRPTSPKATSDAPLTPPAQSDSPEAAAAEDPPRLTVSELKQRLKIGSSAQFKRAGNHFVEAILTDSGVTDLTPLQGQPLKVLDLGRTPVSDLSPLVGM